ncbi:MAG: heme ABC transporter ATP-binding protein [Actinobacteria bacterium]|nr:heme ABC transporter ATP-binding protein [Actinomycetota bacterium]
MTSIIKCENVSVIRTKKQILHDITLEATTGELVAILGPNGAGKSTLLGVLAGDLIPETGTVYYGGKNSSEFSQSDLAKIRAVLPQRVTISFPYSVEEIVEMGRGPRLADGDEGLVESAMRRLEITDMRKRLYRTLSVGEQARVSMARILAQDTQLMLLDEPTAVLDIGQQEKLMGIIRTLVDEGRTVISVFHDLNVAMSFADRVVLLQNGKQLGSGKPRETLTASTLSAIYEHEIEVIGVNDDTGPVVIPVQKKTSPRPER